MQTSLFAVRLVPWGSKTPGGECYLGKKLQPKELPAFDTTAAFSDD